MDASRLWRTNTHLLWESWPQEAVVYHSHSGETHYLNQMAMLTLQKLEQAPANAEQLVEALSILFEPGEIVDDLRPRIERLLQEFDQLGLIEPAE